ncbi:taurine dioxygenase [Pseudomonas cuatrocienegasensis]|uniref:Taurine dioxygenase n=1 Tax=Pseudomonas cuatrocienegasensis TaxID=543360 RepID=A0ABY1B8R6_9PSED|nr:MULTISPECIES: TauD/TfdA family dioxygenase [Pseudomonas]OEC35751.1 taurine dioxygenase [Pseudomonas sp. 21C1]SEQ22533.1 taurine dioxygenase [Pseudomonas cuatrocienegasensis]
MSEFIYTLPSNNPAVSYQHFTATPATGALGAYVEGLDLRDLSAAGYAELRQALLTHKVLFIHDQSLSVTDLEQVTLQFGAFGREPYVTCMEAHPHVVHVVKEADEKAPFVFGGAWHTDWTFQERPPVFTLLYGHDIPPYGGDTCFANLTLAYEWLSPGMQALLEPLDAEHSPERAYGTGANHNALLENMHILYGQDVSDEVRYHPLVIRHPETGKKVLFINPAYTSGIKGLRAAEAQPLLDYLFNLAVSPAFTCRMRWRQGTLAIWDNRSTWHMPVADYHGMRREMFRTTVIGGVPSR